MSEALSIKMHYAVSLVGRLGRWYVDLLTVYTPGGREVVVQWCGRRHDTMWATRLPDTAFGTGFAAAMIREALHEHTMTAPDEMITRAARERVGGILE